jgi:hypothetical protein
MEDGFLEQVQRLRDVPRTPQGESSVLRLGAPPAVADRGCDGHALAREDCRARVLRESLDQLSPRDRIVLTDFYLDDAPKTRSAAVWAWPRRCFR